MKFDFEQLISIIKTTLFGLSQLWQLWLILGLIALIKSIPYFWERYKLAKSGIAEIDKMSGKTFEKYLEIMFKKLGYKVIRTRYVGDYGADLVAEKDGTKTAIQAKRYKGSIGVKAIQEAVASKGYYDCDKAMVISNSHFTKQAKILADKNNVELWDRDKFVNKLLTIKKKTSVENLNGSSTHLTEPAKKCTVCGALVSDKVYQYCLAHQDTFKGKIYCFVHQKKVDTSLNSA